MSEQVEKIPVWLAFEKQLIEELRKEGIADDEEINDVLNRLEQLEVRVNEIIAFLQNHLAAKTLQKIPTE